MPLSEAQVPKCGPFASQRCWMCRVGVEVRVGAGEVSVRCVGWTRWYGIAFAGVFGLLAGSSSIIAMTRGHWLGGAAIGVIGLEAVHWVLAASTASVDGCADGLRVRSGLLRRLVAAGDIQDIRVGGPTGESRVVLF